MKNTRSALALPALVLAGLVLAQFASADPLPNAWQITDNTTSGDGWTYTTNLPSALHSAATNSTGGFRYAITNRFVTNFGGPKALFMAYGLGSRRFLIWWDLNGSGDLTAELEGGLTYVLTTNGTGRTLYHSHEIVYTNGTASYLFDGQVKTNGWLGSANSLALGQVIWGAGSAVGKGQINFNNVTFRITNSMAASYDAGFAPAVAPNPTNSGWTLTSGTTTAATSISPDTALLPLATTQVADQFAPDSARLNGQGNPSGSPAAAWFEWGTTLAYGNSTPPQSVGAGISPAGFSNTINGLVVGTNYQFRAVVSNVFGVANGANQSFNLAVNLPSAATQAADQLTNTSARLNGQANPSGSPTIAWFEWGTNTTYGNLTTPQNIGAGLSTSNINTLVNGLVGGPDYHFRLVASNAFGSVAGADQVFTLSFFPTFIVPEVGRGDSVAWGDYDNDGRLDFLLTGSTNGSIVGAFLHPLWRNTGNGFTSMPQSSLTPCTESSAAWGDCNNDGRLDLALNGVNRFGVSFSMVVTNAPPLFWVQSSFGLPQVLDGSVAWGDYDNDGRLDLLITGVQLPTYYSQLWRNTGGGLSNVTASVTPDLPGVSGSSVAWGDYDNDSRLDFLLTGTTNGVASGSFSQLWRNTDGGFSNVTASVAPGLPGVGAGSVAWGDYDNDGRLDFLLTGNAFTGRVSQVWRNTGSGFTNVTASAAPGLPSVGASSVAWGDYDNDGRLDFLLTGLSPTGWVFQVWRNTGNSFTNIPIPGLPGLSGLRDIPVVWGDYDNDGRLDFLIAGNGPSVPPQVWRNNLPVTNAPPAAPTGLSAIASGTIVTLSWNPATDDHTPSPGLNYNLRIGTTPGASDVLSAMALTNGFRLLPALGNAQCRTNAFYYLPPGTYYWSVQAVDTSFAGSPFAVEQQFTIAPPIILLPLMLGNGQFQFSFSNEANVAYQVLGTTNVAPPLAQWTVVGQPTSQGGGLYQFTDTGAVSNAQRYYLLRAQ